jgi:hypothetical protein
VNQILAAVAIAQMAARDAADPALFLDVEA